MYWSVACGLQYVGRTTRKLSIRIGEHIKNIKKGIRHHSVSNHFRNKHNRDPKYLKFYAIDKIDTKLVKFKPAKESVT